MFDSAPEVTRDSHHNTSSNPPSSSAITSDDEYFDCKSNVSSTKPSLDSNAYPTANNSRRSSYDTSATTPDSVGAGSVGTGRTASTDSSKPQRFRSLTNSQVFPGGSSSRDSNSTFAHSPSHSAPGFGSLAVAVSRSSSLRRAATAMPNVRASPPQGLRVEERARRAVKAMAEACTTGISVREADERRSRAFSRLLVEHRLSSPGRSTNRGARESVPVASPRMKHNAIHLASSHNSIASRTRSESQSDSEREDDTISNNSQAATTSATPEPESRALSLTDDKKAIGLVRSASLEARIDQHTRAALSQWIVCFGSVHFDVDQGPTLNLLYPYVPFSDSERAAICFSSMPDSTIYELYDSVYTFHFRVDAARLGLPKDTVFLYGHVFFRQKRDPLMRRGGFQRSIAIISHLPYHGLFSRMAHMLGPMYFDLGTAILEAAAQNVSSWRQPVPGRAYELPFLGTALSVELPAIDASQLLETSKFPLNRFDPGEHILASVTYDGLFRSFRDTLDDLWTCWELMILGESLVVLADTPSRCSEAIVSLVDIIFPIRYCGDYRPYFTIQDPDFRAIVSKTHVPNNTVVGVSNPFFSEALSHWPHKLFLGSSGRMSQMHGANARKARAFGEVVISGSSDSIGGSSVREKASNSSIGSTTSSAGGGNRKPGAMVSGSGGIIGSGQPGSGGKGIRQGLQTKHKCAVNKDRPFVENLLSAIKTGRETPWMVNNMLRRYFIDLTVQFLAPLDRYFSTLIPKVQSAMAIPQGSQAYGSRSHGQSQQREEQRVISLSWFSPPGTLRPWRTDDFMESLASFGISPQLSSRHSATTAAEVFASVFSGSSSANYTGNAVYSSNYSSGSNSSRMANAQRADTALGRRQYHAAETSANAAAAGGTSSFSLWKSKKGAKRVSDEWMQLYEQFLKCGNFATWLAHRTSEAQRALVVRFRQEVCQGDVHAWCRGYDYTFGLDEEQLAAEMEALELATMDLGQSSRGAGAACSSQPHADHVFYHGEEEEERRRAEQHRQRILREQQQRLAGNGRPVYGSDGTLVGFAQVPGQQPKQQSGSAPARRKLTSGSSKRQKGKQLGQRVTQARRAQAIVFQAAWLTAQLLGESAISKIPSPVQSQAAATIDIGGVRDCPPSDSETALLLEQLSVLVEYMPAETGRIFLPLVGEDFACGDGQPDDV
ncbi:hypothetical protein GGI22_004003 [Coemansia erecta]|nr:hypothetical protein GGI22_004003 [Coemansia erecta]